MFFSCRRRESPASRLLLSATLFTPTPPYLVFGRGLFRFGAAFYCIRGFEKRGSSKREETQCENARSSVSPLNGKKAKNLAFSSPPYISKKERKRREVFFRGKTTPTFFCGEGKRGNSICLGKGPLLLFFFLLFYFWKVLAGCVV